MPEELIIQQASPTLAGLKTGSLFTCPFQSEQQLRAEVEALNRRLTPKGVKMRIMRLRRRALLYLYRPEHLQRDFAGDDAAEILSACGYSTGDVESCVLRLRERIRDGGAFPHEVGLFLGYPPEDVRGFIEGGTCKCVGCWKVYGDEDSARRRFAQFRKCTSVYTSLYARGRSIERLTVRS